MRNIVKRRESKKISEHKVKKKWFYLLRTLVLPILILGHIYILLGLFLELFGFTPKWTLHILTELLGVFGASIFNLRGSYWPVIILVTVLVVQLVLLWYAWTGSFKYKNHSKNCWIAFLIIDLLFDIATFVYIHLNVIQTGRLKALIQALGKLVGLNLKAGRMSTFLAYLIMALWIAFEIFFLVINIMYFSKRKHLFKTDYVAEPKLSHEEDKWLCPTCGNMAQGNYCDQCHTAKPKGDASEICPFCGSTMNGNTCYHCGYEKKA